MQGPSKPLGPSKGCGLLFLRRGMGKPVGQKHRLRSYWFRNPEQVTRSMSVSLSSGRKSEAAHLPPPHSPASSAPSCPLHHVDTGLHPPFQHCSQPVTDPPTLLLPSLPLLHSL